MHHSYLSQCSKKSSKGKRRQEKGKCERNKGGSKGGGLGKGGENGGRYYVAERGQGNKEEKGEGGAVGRYGEWRSTQCRRVQRGVKKRKEQAGGIINVSEEEDWGMGT